MLWAQEEEREFLLGDMGRSSRAVESEQTFIGWAALGQRKSEE